MIQVTGFDLMILITQACTGFLLACSSSVTGIPDTSSGGAIMSSIRCWIMWSQNSVSS